MMKILRYILFPVVPIYYLVTWLRNKLYDLEIKKSKSYNSPVICVGNLSVGGTGKTPMIEYLIRLLKDEYQVATLSRGYKRNSKGFQLGNKDATAESLGDEPFQFYNKFGNDIKVAVDKNRQHGINSLSNLDNPPKVILLDDAFQHRKVKAGFNILLTTYSHPYYDDSVLPTGNLREPRNGVKRANVIVVTKCPKGLTESEKEAIIKRINPNKNQSIFFSYIEYSNTLVSVNEKIEIKDLSNFTLVTGIANSKPLVDYLKGENLRFQHLNFKDHHEFSQKEIEVFKTKELILTTEKDFMRLKNYVTLKHKLFYIPINVVINKEAKFNKIMKRFVTSF